MKKHLNRFLILLAALSFALPAFAQRSAQSPLARVGGWYVAANYAKYSFIVTNGTTASGAATITVQGSGTLPDGNPVVLPLASPFAPITIDVGANQETVTPTAVSATSCAGGGLVCFNITATFSNAHGNSTVLTSGDNGIIEALLAATQGGGGDVYWEVDCGPVTLNTGGATTTTTCNVPQSFTNLGGSAFVNTTVTTAASYSLGIASATASFFSACTSLTAGTNCSQFQVSPTKVATGTGLGALLITANATPGAGVVHVKAWGYTAAQANY